MYITVKYIVLTNRFFPFHTLSVWGYPVQLPSHGRDVVEMALNQPASASSAGFVISGDPQRTVDGDINTIHHSACNEATGPWWMVDLGAESFVEHIDITNRVDCCAGRLRDTWVHILNEAQEVVESRYISGSVSAGGTPQLVFNEDTSVGRYVKVHMPRQDCLHMAEVAVYG